jgi:hypothetical protein
MHILGDRNITGLDQQSCDPTGIKGAVTWLTPTNNPSWSMSIHRWAGNITRVDGSVTRLGRSGIKAHCQAAFADTHANCALKPDCGVG